MPKAVISTPPHDDPYQVWVVKEGERVTTENRIGYFHYEQFTALIAERLNNYIKAYGYDITSGWVNEFEFRVATCQKRE